MAKDSGIRVGDVFTRLTVIEIKKGGVYVCQCSCGNIKETFSSRLKDGRNKSCGCLNSEREVYGGLSMSPEYTSYHSMMLRTGNEHSSKLDGRYDAYIGMEVEPRWLQKPTHVGFLAFYEDMGPRPEGATLNRKDNNIGYLASNCEWATLGEQAYNRTLFKNNTSGKTGVYYRKDSGKWRPKISVDGKIINLGTYDTFEEALAVREAAELKYYGRTKE